VRAAENAPDPARGLDGYVTTYQAVAAAPDLHLAEFSRHRTLLVVDEIHHLPALSDAEPTGRVAPPDGAPDPEAAWSRAILPLLEVARIRLLLSGTLMRADGRAILWLPYRSGAMARTREVEVGLAEARGHQRHLLRAARGLRVAPAARQLPALVQIPALGQVFVHRGASGSATATGAGAVPTATGAGAVLVHGMGPILAEHLARIRRLI
jgi:hypothetical protein